MKDELLTNLKIFCEAYRETGNAKRRLALADSLYNFLKPTFGRGVELTVRRGVGPVEAKFVSSHGKGAVPTDNWRTKRVPEWLVIDFASYYYHRLKEKDMTYVDWQYIKEIGLYRNGVSRLSKICQSDNTKEFYKEFLDWCFDESYLTAPLPASVTSSNVMLVFVSRKKGATTKVGSGTISTGNPVYSEDNFS